MMLDEVLRFCLSEILHESKYRVTSTIDVIEVSIEAWNEMFRYTLVLAMTVLMSGLTTAARSIEHPILLVSDQLVVGNEVLIDSVVSDEEGLLVIHAGDRESGTVIGYESVVIGETRSLEITIDIDAALPELVAVLYRDAETPGEFDGAENDLPLMIDNQAVEVSFKITLISAEDQFVNQDVFIVNRVILQETTWIVARMGDGPTYSNAVAGLILLDAGIHTNVEIHLGSIVSNHTIWLMLHKDTGITGEFEYGQGINQDDYLIFGNRLLMEQFWTSPHVRIEDQIVRPGDSLLVDTESQGLLVVKSVLTDTPAFLVVYQDLQGVPGAIIGISEPLSSGYHSNIEVSVPLNQIGDRIWSTLYTDTATPGMFTPGTTHDKDIPHRNVLIQEPIYVAPSIIMTDQPLMDHSGIGPHIHVPHILSDASAWAVIYQRTRDGRGQLIGYVLVNAGSNTDVVIPVDSALVTDSAEVALIYDLNQQGIFEGEGENAADTIVSVRGHKVRQFFDLLR